MLDPTLALSHPSYWGAWELQVMQIAIIRLGLAQDLVCCSTLNEK